MAKRIPLVIDAQVQEVTVGTPLSKLVPATVQSVTTHEGRIIPREAFERYRADDIPDGFDTQHATINKAASRIALLHNEAALLQSWLDGFEPPDVGAREACINDSNEYLYVRNFPLPDSYQPDYIDLVLYVDQYPTIPPIGVYLLDVRAFAPTVDRISANINVFQDRAFHGAEKPLPGFRWVCLVSENWRVDYRDLREGQNLMKYLAYFYGLLAE